MLDVVLDPLELKGEEQRLGLEITRLQDEQDAVSQAPVALGDGAFFRGEGKVIGSLLVRELWQTVEFLDLLLVQSAELEARSLPLTLSPFKTALSCLL